MEAIQRVRFTQEKIEFGLDELARFLVAAKKNCYASGDDFRVAAQRQGFKEFEFKDGEWSYRDSYVGFFRAPGQEVVRYNEVPVWTMSYHGGMTDESARPEFAKRVFSFLKRALLEVKVEKPFRGPELGEGMFGPGFWEGEFSYFCKSKGGILEFNGEEIISHRQEGRIFVQNFGGGLVIPKGGVELIK